MQACLVLLDPWEGDTRKEASETGRKVGTQALAGLACGAAGSHKLYTRGVDAQLCWSLQAVITESVLNHG
jgi:hypothetical protein